MKYAKLNRDGSLTYWRSDVVKKDGVTYANPGMARMREAGWLPVAEPRPPASRREGWHLEQDGWRVLNNVIQPKWRTVKDAPPAPKEYDVYRLILALKSLDVTFEGQTVKAIVPAVEWLKANGLYEEFLTIRTLREDDTDLMAAVSTLASTLGVTDAQVAEIMESALVA